VRRGSSHTILACCLRPVPISRVCEPPISGAPESFRAVRTSRSSAPRARNPSVCCSGYPRWDGSRNSNAPTPLTTEDCTFTMYVQSRGAEQRPDSPPTRSKAGRQMRGSLPTPGHDGTNLETTTVAGRCRGERVGQGSDARAKLVGTFPFNLNGPRSYRRSDPVIPPLAPITRSSPPSKPFFRHSELCTGLSAPSPRRSVPLPRHSEER
jgi:hypothetical protein